MEVITLLRFKVVVTLIAAWNLVVGVAFIWFGENGFTVAVYSVFAAIGAASLFIRRREQMLRLLYRECDGRRLGRIKSGLSYVGIIGVLLPLIVLLSVLFL